MNCIIKRLLQIYVVVFLGSLSPAMFAQSLQDQAKIQYYRSMIEDEKVPYQQKIAFYDSTLNYYRNAKDYKMERTMAIKKMQLSSENGGYIESYKTGAKILDEMKNLRSLSRQDSLEMNKIRLILGKNCRNLGMYDESISYFFSIVQQPVNRYTIDACSYLGFVFMHVRQMEKSKTYNSMALKLLSETDSATMMKTSSTVYNSLAGYYYTTKQLDSALYYLNLSVKYYDYAEDISSKSYMFHNMAIIYQDMGEYAMAKDYLQKAIDVSHKEPYNYARLLQNMAFLLYEIKELGASEEYYLRALQAAEAAGAIQIKGSVLIELSDLYYNTHQYQKACDYMKQGMVIRDSLFSNQNMEKISILSQQFDNYKISTEKNLLEKELQLANLSNLKKNVILIILLFLLLVVSVVAFVLVRRIYRSSVKNIEKETSAQQEVIRKEYEVSLEEKDRKLASNALFLMKTNEMLGSLDRSIKQLLITKEQDKQKSITEEMASVISSYNSHQGWDEFKLYFEQIHHSFYTNLDKINPNLTKMEQRLCALLVLNMNTKEIAQITNRSVRTIETLIYRLRRNLNIPTDEKTVQFLRKLLDD
ncbi:tetratricopeptide (TPR) repeat protein [Dysgonomonas sp. PH5-45]|uniref:tetratricopeptide repeat protein n=1 Tax=unclassified Dysgonomonas TaxID=2630389 RepID=UPI002475C693|nr:MULTISPECIES: tetratricopeptide repeat protein [unclassified Dysgonomonas]MDH6355191.1 tetratricopeptide (TPR) repeat protein [Dysgonomonas sp. PH5-45]MDH6388083.1 tetratricopeptide (TPR) repeat protein [Dysgonomonas sp. PH5-37]